MKERVNQLRRHWWFRIPLIILAYFILPLCFFPGAVLFHGIRAIAILMAKIFQPQFGLPISPESGLTTVDNFWEDGEVMHAVVGVHYTDGQVQRNRVVKRMKEILMDGKFPELGQKLTRFLGIYFWGPCPSFKLENHITEMPSVRTLREVQLAQDTLCRKGFTRDQPLWEITLFPNYIDKEDKGNEGSAFALRVHHCLTDGAGHVSLLNAIGGVDPPPLPPPLSWYEWTVSTLNYAGGIVRLHLNQYAYAIAFITDYNYNYWYKPAAQRSRGVSFYESHELELASVKKAAKCMGHTVSEVIMASFATALREDMEAHKEPVPLTMSAIHPQAKPGHPGSLTNHAYMNTLVLPVGTRDRTQQLNLLREDYRLKKEAAPISNLPITMFGIFLQLAGFLPSIGPYTSCAVTNFAISSQAWELFGTTVKRTSFVFDMSEHVGMVAMFIGYRDKMFLWLKARKDIMPTDKRPKAIINSLIRQVKDMGRTT